MRYAFTVALAATMAGCAASSSSPRGSDPAPMAAGQDDVVVLRGGERVVGRIVRIDEQQIVMESGERVRVFSRRDVVETSWARPQENRQALRAADESKAPKVPVPPSSWYPRLAQSEPVTQVEVTFYETHPLARCLGALAEPTKAAPELTLFAEAGGKIVVHDTRKWGYHAHVMPGDQVLKPQEKPGLAIEVPKAGAAAIEAVAIVSPAQEMKAVETQRTSYAIPDAVYATVRELSSADRALGAQPFAGGRAKDTADGTLWAFSLPRNDRQCWVYLLDAGKKHGKVLEQSFAAYGEALLAPDLIVDMVAADGVTVGRVMLLPIPETISADGPAPEPIQILVGKDASVETTVPVPPRQAVVLPPRAPSTRADVYVNCYEVSQTVQERLVVAHGTGPLSDTGVRVVSRELGVKTSSEHVSIDLSSLPEDKFPVVAWLYHRRTWMWKAGGWRGEWEQQGGGGAAPARAPKPPRAVISNRGRLPHVLPILFVGPKPVVGGGGAADLASPVVGGMSSALMADSLLREMGSALNAMSALANLADKGDGGGKGGGGDATNVTNIYITIPPHTSMTTPGVRGDGGAPVGTPFLNFDPNRPNYQGGASWSPYTAPGAQSIYQGGYGVYNQGTGQWSNNMQQPMGGGGGVTYDPRTGSMSGGGNAPDDMMFRDPATNVVMPVRRTRR